jgi:hypothetical protein
MFLQFENRDLNWFLEFKNRDLNWFLEFKNLEFVYTELVVAIRAWQGFLSFSILLAPGLAYAGPLEECAALAEQTQLDQRAGRLIEAQKKALQCASNSQCPSHVRADCDGWLKEAQAAQPTVLIRVVLPDGKDADDPKISVDGKPLTGFRAGRAVEVDPGKHTFVAEFGELRAETDAIAGEGEKSRLVTLTFRALEVVDVPTGPPSQPLIAPRPVPASVWITGAIGVVGLGAFGVFAIEGQAKYSACKPNCQASAAGLELRRGLAFGALGIGVVALAISAVLFVTRPRVSQQTRGELAYYF